MFDRFLPSSRNRNNVAVFVDGPNMIRKEFDIDLDDLREAAEALGTLKVAKVFLNQYASEKLVEAIISQGFEPELGLGGQKDRDSDVDVYMAVQAMDAVYNDRIDTIALVTRDTDFLPVIQRAKELGKKTVILGVEEGLSTALGNAADKKVIIES
ncbi:MAG: TIGR00288 family NYN domain-containing protein [Candidatus Nanohaloarchaea archaeon]|nr:TIGR00288 family NYN domain-containing protein [Candidatus Nanohaloarchaea archaeon]